MTQVTAETSAPERLGRRDRARRSWTPVIVGSLASSALLAVWQAAAVTDMIPRRLFPAPTDILESLVSSVGNHAFWTALGATATSWAWGLVISIVVALVLALLVGTFAFVRESTWVLLDIMRPIPPIALLPVGLLLFGTGPQMKLLLIVYTSFWPLFTQIVYGIRDIDQTALNTMRAYRVSRPRRLVTLVIPTVAPYAGTGLRLAAVSALVVSLVTEIIGGAKGLGLSISTAQLAGNYPEMYAGIAVTGIAGLGINAVFADLERRALFWIPRDTRSGR